MRIVAAEVVPFVLALRRPLVTAQPTLTVCPVRRNYWSVTVGQRDGPVTYEG